MKYWNIIQAVLFYIIWFLSVKLISSNNINNEIIAILLLLLFGFLSLVVNSAKISFVQNIVFVSIVGIFFDFLLIKLNLFSYINFSLDFFNYPLWIISMWFAFSTTYLGCLNWLLHSSLKAFLFGAIGGALSLYSGTIFEVATIINPLSLIPVGLVWGVIVYLQCKIISSSFNKKLK
jgi:hypothetical protein